MSLFKMLLYFHVACGAVNLLFGLVIIILRKGDRRHKNLGKVFFYTMMLVAVTAILLTFIHPNMGLASIGVFSGYMVLSGFMVIRKDFEKRKLFLIPALLFGLYTAGKMIYTGNIILIVFGSILGVMASTDIFYIVQKKVPYKRRLGSHIGKMTGAFIASTTAFLVNAVYVGSAWYIWLLPTIFFAPLIAYWQVIHMRKKVVKVNG